MPFEAPFPIPTISAVGVASPKAHGQAIISTAIKLSSALLITDSSPKTNQPINVNNAVKIIAGTKTAATLSASCCIWAFEP